MKVEIFDKEQFVLAGNAKVGHIYKMKDGTNHYVRIREINPPKGFIPFLNIGINSNPLTDYHSIHEDQKLTYVGEAKISLV